MVLGAISGLIPKIEGFAPLPNASADAFMAMQGGHMALYFGAMYQFGKRIVSSQTNESFNAIAKNPKLLTQMLDPHYKEITNAFENHANSQFERVQTLVMEKAYQIEILKVHQNVKLLKELPSAYWQAIFETEKTISNIDSGIKPPSTVPPVVTPPKSQPRGKTIPKSSPVPGVPKFITTITTTWLNKHAQGRIVKRTLPSKQKVWSMQSNQNGNWRVLIDHPINKALLREHSKKSWPSKSYNHYHVVKGSFSGDYYVLRSKLNNTTYK